MSDIIIRRPDDAEYEVVKKYVDLFWLDNSYMRKEQFLILLYGGRFAAFVRIKKHSTCIELCSLGVLDEFRGRHLGMTLVNAALSDVKKDIYLVTVEPDYFRNMGFTFAKNYPAIIHSKCDKCRSCYAVGKTYRVMKWAGRK